MLNNIVPNSEINLVANKKPISGLHGLKNIVTKLPQSNPPKYVALVEEDDKDYNNHISNKII
jgi:hypothetical protein